jgi:septum formation protein
VTSPPVLLLASGSPRRRALLDGAGIRFEIQRPDIVEERAPGEAPEALARRLADAKAAAVAQRVGPVPRRWVLAADTIVVLADQVLGKPQDPEHAVELLGQLVGRTHRVLTAVTLLDSAAGTPHRTLVESTVRMRGATRAEIVRYIATGESLDKAGAYALQGAGRRFVTTVEGSESNVIGLPLEQTLALLKAAGAT